MRESSATHQAASACLDASETALKSSSLWDVHDRLSVAAETEAGETEQDPVYEQQLAAYLKELRFTSFNRHLRLSAQQPVSYSGTSCPKVYICLLYPLV